MNHDEYVKKINKIHDLLKEVYDISTELVEKKNDPNAAIVAGTLVLLTTVTSMDNDAVRKEYALQYYGVNQKVHEVIAKEEKKRSEEKILDEMDVPDGTTIH